MGAESGEDDETDVGEDAGDWGLKHREKHDIMVVKHEAILRVNMSKHEECYNCSAVGITREHVIQKFLLATA